MLLNLHVVNHAFAVTDRQTDRQTHTHTREFICLLPVWCVGTHLEGSCGVDGWGAAEPASSTAEVGIPGLVDEAGWRRPGLRLPQVVKPIGCLGVQPHTEVVVKQPFHLS